MKHDIISKILLSQVVEKITPITYRKNGEYIAKCVSGQHLDKRPSMHVSDNMMRFKCFSCGFGGDAIDFVMKTQNVDFNRAVAILEGDDRLIIPEHELNEINNKRKKKSFDVLPLANPNIPPTFNHSEYGMPKIIYPYKNLLNQLIGYTCRFEFPDGTKDILPYVFGRFENGIEAWKYAGFQNPRPMYGMEFLGAYPNAKVIIVEGEKCADYGNRKMHESEYRGKYVFCTWIGGAEAVQKTDLSVVFDRDVILWPDNDEPGIKAMKSIGKIIGGKYIHIPADKPEKWDLADSDFTAEQIISFIDENTHVDSMKIKSEKTVVEVKPAEVPKPPSAPAVIDSLGEMYFRVLGYSKNEKSHLTYWFYSYEPKMVVCFTASGLTKSNLMTLAPILWWESRFPGPGNSKLNMDSAVQSLIAACNRVGIFDEEKIRGRGAWRDNDKVVLHVGNKLIIDGKKCGLHQFESNYIYEVNKPIKYGGVSALNKFDAYKFMELMQWFSWDRPETAYTFAGWLVIAPFCGILDNRPNGWLTAQSGTGKTWIQENVVRRILGDIAISVNSDTTAPGIRQSLQSDARPLIFDETEAESIQARQRLKDVLMMLRGSFSNGESKIIKGGMDGRAKAYEIKTMAMFSSIGVYLDPKADKRRFTIFGLKNDSSKRDDAFDQYKEKYFSIVTDDYIRALQERTINMLPIIIQNVKVFSKAINKKLNDTSVSDLLGGLLAGAWSLMSDDVVEFNQAFEFVDRFEWNNEKIIKDEKDEILMFQEIMSTQIRIDNINSFTIGELLSFEHNPLLINELMISNDTARFRYEINRALGNYGIKYVKGRICFANNNPALKRLMYNSAWVHAIDQLLLRLPDAEKDNPREYVRGQGSKRGISVPVELLTEYVS